MCKFFTVMESPIFGMQTKQGWKNLYGMAWTTSVIFDNIEKVVDQIWKNEQARLSEVFENMPQTEALVGKVLRNLSPFILDAVDIITLKPVALVSTSSKCLTIVSLEDVD